MDALTGHGPADHVLANRAHWDRMAGDWVDSGRSAWAADEPRWGVFALPESRIGLLAGFAGGDVVELGCGTGYVSAWLARRGGRPVGVDNSAAQLATAAAFQAEFGLRFPLVHGDAERLPFPDRSFDFAVSEYGAAIWCDPHRWLPEAARVLRPGGRLVFLGNSPLMVMCVNDDWSQIGEGLARSQFGMHRFDDPDDDSVEFHLSHGELIDIFGSCGLTVERLVELRPGVDTPPSQYPWAAVDWARRWPLEEAWILRRNSGGDGRVSAGLCLPSV